MKITFKVTKEDIELGKQLSSRSCPIALSVLRELKLKKGEVGICRSGGPNRAGKKILLLPDKCDEFIDNFDADGKKMVKPFKFVGELMG